MGMLKMRMVPTKMSKMNLTVKTMAVKMMTGASLSPFFQMEKAYQDLDQGHLLKMTLKKTQKNRSMQTKLLRLAMMIVEVVGKISKRRLMKKILEDRVLFLNYLRIIL